ncbi:MAG TPA: ABC transporter permease [Thermomicrobiaceae bacterium]|nr:ABC transporter permease [Thermomicrobiaceae bacterium]
MSRGRYILRRLSQMVPVLFGITLIIFLLLRLIPGDPAILLAGDHASDAAIAQVRHAYGLDRPIWVQYLYFMRNLFELNLGQSLSYHIPVASLIRQRLPVSLSVVVFTALITTVVSLPLGLLAALKKDSWLDNVVRSTLMITMVMPSFWIGIIFIIILSINFGLFPVSGYGTGFGDHVKHLFLPSLTISLSLAPILIRALRANVLETMRADYTRTARAKGLSEGKVVRTHVLRNALIPWVTLLGLSVGSLMGGTVITEKVFGLPGAGALMIDSITARDYPVVQASTLIFAFMVILVNLTTDIIYSFIDPRIRFG